MIRRKAFDAVTFAATGTLLFPKHSVAEVYWVAAHNHGNTERTVEEVREGMHRARYTWGQHRPKAGEEYWAHVAYEATGSSSSDLHAELFAHYGDPAAWRLGDKALPVLRSLRAANVRTAVVENADSRMGTVLEGLGVSSLLDAVVLSGDVGVEKPGEAIFEYTLRLLEVEEPERAVHVGIHYLEDSYAAESADMEAWLFGEDVYSLTEVLDQVAPRTTTSRRTRPVV